ncbi:MAG TPA: hypothetical protein ENK59_02555 [Thioploca sp.]|nr:hypothetical protein [Thioploca sp.]
MQKIILSIIILMSFNYCIADEIKIPPAKLLQSPVEKHPALKNTIAGYMEAWKKQDFDTMYTYESWESGKQLKKGKEYLMSFRKDLQIHTWKITKVEPLDNGEYKVLVLISHNPPKRMMRFIKEGTTVRSTLNQWWKEQDGKFVHMLNFEREKNLELLRSPPMKNIPSVPK